jgi:hypothetical protein
MTNMTANSDGKGTRRTKSRNRRWWALMLAPLAAIPILRFVHQTFWPKGVILAGALNPQFAIYSAALAVLNGLIFGVIYHRIIDEQEENSALWGMTIGFYLLAFGGIAWFFLAAAKLVPLVSFLAVWIGSATVAAAAQLWLQFR